MTSRQSLADTNGFSRQWWITAIGGALVLVSLAFIDVDSVERAVLGRVAGMVASVILLGAILTMPKSVRSVWLCMGTFLLLTAIADVIYDYQDLILEISAFPGIADGFYLVSYIFAITALFLLARKMNPGADLSSWIDILIMFVAACAIVGAFVIAPGWTSTTQMDLPTILWLTYPLLDLVLLAALTRLLMLPHARNPAISLLAVSMALFLAYDLLFNNQLLSADWTPANAMELVWSAAYLCLALAALSPGARQFVPVDPSRVGVVTTTRQLMIGIAVLAVPAIILLELSIAGEVVLYWLVPGIVLLLALVLIRMHLLLRTSQRQASALDELDRKDLLTGLPNRTTWNTQLSSRVSSTSETGTVITIAIVSIDNFTELRQAKSQHIGDLLIISATIAWLGELTSTDVLAKYTDNEFAVLIQRDSVAQTQEVLRRLLRASPQGMHVSSGAALLRADEEPVEAERRAAKSLRASQSGSAIQSALDENITN
ncbi:MAG: GGDEF domain-containing protein [Actinomycetota bacterium]|nr:GGDEF domain-containing protein [Actinomycetota bacterium]